MKVPIVLCVDSKGIKFINPLIRSIKDNVPNNEIHLITDSDYETESVYKRYHFESPINTPSSVRYTKYMWVRCWIDEIIPDLKKFIYLDFDCIVTGDISDMLDGDDWIVKAVKYPSGPNFCSGVMAFNFNNPITKEVMDNVRSYAHPANHDEEVLNTFFKRHLTWISAEYMVMDLGSIASKKVIPKVIHYCGGLKAWMHPLQYYYRYCNQDDIIDLRK